MRISSSLAILILVILTTSTSVSSQIEVLEQKRQFTSGLKTAFVFSAERQELKDKHIESAWEDYVEDFNGDLDFDNETKMYFAEETEIPSISQDPLHIFMRMSNISKDQTEFTIWFRQKDGSFLQTASSKTQAQAGKSWVMEFALKLIRMNLEEVLDELEDELDDLTDDKEDLEDDLKSAQKSIEKYQKKIEDEKEEIEEIKNELPQLKIKVSAKQSEVDKVRSKLDALN
ncbi:MAG: hypothetical protein GVX78_03255 [Bacteroidetes bacterium]|jgi:peptidoglycan hydrolase CwlO-like protein|nr:hypothetical protein [Bacteroidota bacterium]